jgi:hypothetical protein
MKRRPAFSEYFCVRNADGTQKQTYLVVKKKSFLKAMVKMNG